MEDFIIEMNATTFSEPHYSFVYNVFKYLFFIFNKYYLILFYILIEKYLIEMNMATNIFNKKM